MKTKDELKAISAAIVDAAMKVHREFGSGLLARVDEAAVASELQSRGFSVFRQVPLPVHYKGRVLDVEGYKLDFLVDDSVIMKLRTVAGLLPIHEAQLSTYLRLSNKRLSLLNNFHVLMLRDGIKRRIH